MQHALHKKCCCQSILWMFWQWQEEFQRIAAELQRARHSASRVTEAQWRQALVTQIGQFEAEQCQLYVAFAAAADD